jgi:Spy/CpxP family protein refolding chaperone
MKHFNLFKLLFIGLLMFGSVSVTLAQEETPSAPDETQKESGRRRQRPNLLQELGLSNEQMEQIRRLNAERKTLMIDAQKRHREAMRSLDQAIYADTINESEIESRLKEVQAAQAEVARLRSMTELEVRKILTPEQLVKFRELRRNFAEKRENFQRRRENRRNQNPNSPNRRFNRHLRKIPNS